MVSDKLKNVIEALSLHTDPQSIRVLEELGTNSPDDEIRALTARALVRKNSHEALELVILSKGKGINDLNTDVSLGTLNELLALKDKSEMMKVLDDTIEMHSDEEVRENAKSVKTLLALS